MASCDNVGYNKLYTFMNTFESCAYAAFYESCFFLSLTLKTVFELPLIRFLPQNYTLVSLLKLLRETVTFFWIFFVWLTPEGILL